MSSSNQIDCSSAKQILQDAYKLASEDKFKPNSAFKDEISFVINNTHLTYRYILLTAVLSKSVSNNVNPLALQASSNLDGAYDARSVCHSVIVPFERDYLKNALGGSNEPFLNKPARFKELSLNNAVRRGNDKRILELLCSFLPKIENTDQAFHSLVDAVYYILRLSETKNTLPLTTDVKASKCSEIINFIKVLTAKSHEGESCVLAAGTLISCLGNLFIKDCVVKVHPVNQAGTSSNEVNDIDVYKSDKIIWTFEIKDKKFTKYDVEHAIKKTKDNHCNSLFFVRGIHALTHDFSARQFIDEQRSNGFLLNIIGIIEFSELLIGLCENIDLKFFVETILKVSKQARIKNPTHKHLIEVLKQFGFIQC